MIKDNLTWTVQKSVTTLILVGILIMTLWSAFNHYFGSYQGGIAWISTSRSAVKNALEISRIHQEERLSLLLYSEFDLLKDHQALFVFDSTQIKEAEINSLSFTTSKGIHAKEFWPLVQLWLTDVAQQKPDQSQQQDLSKKPYKLFGYKEYAGQLYELTLYQDQHKHGVLVSLVNQDWLSSLEKLTATEYILLSSRGELLQTTFKCEAECSPNFVQSELQARDQTRDQTRDQAGTHTSSQHFKLNLASPYLGAYEQFHIGAKDFSVFAAQLPLYNIQAKIEAHLWVMVPENVMLFWPKVGVLGIVILGSILIFFLLRKLAQFTQEHIAPISELVDEVNLIREGFDQHSSSHSTSIPIKGEVERLRAALHLLKDQIQENNQLSDQLRQAQKLEVIGTLAGGVAHDFNNLMSVILMNTEILKEDFGALIQSVRESGLKDETRINEKERAGERDGEPVSKQGSEQADKLAVNIAIEDLELWAEQADEMLLSCDQAKVLTQQLLSLSRDRRQDHKVFLVQSACEEMAKLFRRVIREEVSFNLMLPDEQLYIEGNENAFNQALMNLVVNGRDALKGMGRLTIRVERWEQQQKQVINSGSLHPGSYVLITVEDNGEGIPKNHLDRLFEPFFSSKGSKGTGLGLTVVYNTIVRAMNGGIEVISELGQGTSFKLYVPLAKIKQIQKAKLIPSITTPLRLYSVMLVEDNDQVRVSLANTLERFGFRVSSFASAIEFLQWLEQNDKAMDIVLSDVVMPSMSGPELWREMQKTHPNLPFLFLTGYADEAVRKYNVPTELVLNKPIAPHELKERLLTILNQL